jgi:hypothetical protein
MSDKKQNESEHEETIADLDAPEGDAEIVKGGVVTSNNDPDTMGRHGRSAGVVESVNVKYT